MQWFLAENRDNLLSKGILFSRVGLEFADEAQERHLGFRFAMEPPERPPTGLMTRVGLGSQNARAAYAREYVAAFDAELETAREAGVDTCIISDESLFVFAQLRTLRNLEAFAAPRFDRVDVLCFIREPSRFLSASYSQHVKTGATESFAAFLNHRLRRPLYRDRLELWRQVFGGEHVTLKVLKGDVIDGLSTYLNRDLGHRSAQLSNNRSLSLPALRTLRGINRLCAETGRDRPRWVREVFERTGTRRPWRCDEPTTQMIRASCWPEIERLMQDYDLSPTDRSDMGSWRPGFIAPTVPTPGIDRQTKSILWRLMKVALTSK